jgi:hypothetical protein
VQDDFAILAIDVVEENSAATLRVRADFAHPVVVAGRVLYPMNSNPRTAGWMQVNVTAGGVLQYLMMAIIVVLAWPTRSLLDYAVRLVIALPLAFLLAVLATATTILAELWFPVHADLAPSETWLLLTWSRFLMGGGGLALALGVAALAIAIAANRKPLINPERLCDHSRTVQN